MKATSKRTRRERLYVDVKRYAADEEDLRLAYRKLVLNDLYFLLAFVCGRTDLRNDWLFDRCNEVQGKPNFHLDLWAREHYKSTVITFGLTIQDILYDPEITIGLFSVTRPDSKKFLRQIQRELGENEHLKRLFPEILWAEPHKEAPRWSLDYGLVVKRDGNPREATIEAHGLTDSMPTGSHFKLRVYDDVITEKHVTNPDMIRKATEAWELSLNLGSAQPTKRYAPEVDLERYIGTRYHFNDPYKTIMDRQVATKRIYPGTSNGQVDGTPLLWTPDFLAKKRRNMGRYIFACQILQNPKADDTQGFDVDWLRYWQADNLTGLNLYLLCDPAGEKKENSDYTAMGIVGLGRDSNIYIPFFFRDRLNLKERTKWLMHLHRTYNPIAVGYEKYGKDSDIEHIESVQEQENYRFDIIPLGGKIPKNDRIKRLVPDCEDGRFYLPFHCWHVDQEGNRQDMTRVFIDDEYEPFPVGLHDDMFDMLSRIKDEDLGAVYPKANSGYKFKRKPKRVKV